MSLPADGLVAVYPAPRAAFELHRLPLREPRRGEVLVRVRMCTICRSDIHSYLGHRSNPTPGVLGHEIIGSIVALGEGIERDMRGDRLAIGDRITWSEFFVPEAGFHAEVLDLPQKSAGLGKYGHLSVEQDPHHHGGFGQFCYVLPRSWILRLPGELSDAEATPVNCGVATAVCLVEQAAIRPGGSVVIQGLGLLGLYAAAIAKSRGAGKVIGIDGVAARRAMGERFGCDVVIDPAGLSDDGLVARVRAQCPPIGADAVIEICGDPSVVPQGLAMLREGGVCVIGGLVSPGAWASIDLNQVLRKLITLRGVHNYHPRHLLEALDFVTANRARYPFAELVDGRYRLDQVSEAIRDADERRVIRAAIVP
jgi:putative phosphonate catabolism associated alcohol dehydrogenase